MAMLPDVVRQSELLHQLVLNRGSMEQLGRIEVMWMYPPAHRVLGFVCKAGFFGNQKLAFKLAQIEAIGGDGVITHSEPDATDADRVRQLESLIQSEVWSNAGQKLGKIIDFVFNLRTGAIAYYLVVGDRFNSLTGSIYQLPPHKIMSLGRERVLVAETALSQLPLYRAGLQEKISQVGATLRDEYEDATDELRSLAQRAQTTTQHTRDQLKTLAEQAKERALQLAEQLREQAQEVNGQWLEDLDVFSDKTQESVTERKPQSADDWGESRQSPPQTVTIPAQTMPTPEDEWDLDWDDDHHDDQQLKHERHSDKWHQKLDEIDADVWGEDPEDVWVIDDNLTLKRPDAIASPAKPPTPIPATDPTALSSSTSLDNSLDDDPWQIIEPPDQQKPCPASAEGAISNAAPPGTPDETDEDDEPWI